MEPQPPPHAAPVSSSTPSSTNASTTNNRIGVPSPPLPIPPPTLMTNVDFSNYPLKEITHPHPHDVLCGRGGGTNNHVGNSHWRMLVAANKQLYITLPKRQKMLLSRSIVNAVRSQNPPGRFLQKDPKSEKWYDVGDQRAQEKTSQALREGAPDIRVKMATTTSGANDISLSNSVMRYDHDDDDGEYEKEFDDDDHNRPHDDQDEGADEDDVVVVEQHERRQTSLPTQPQPQHTQHPLDDPSSARVAKSGSAPGTLSAHSSTSSPAVAAAAAASATDVKSSSNKKHTKRPTGVTTTVSDIDHNEESVSSLSSSVLSQHQQQQQMIMDHHFLPHHQQQPQQVLQYHYPEAMVGGGMPSVGYFVTPGSGTTTAALSSATSSSSSAQQPSGHVMYYSTSNMAPIAVYPTMVLNEQGMMVPAMSVIPPPFPPHVPPQGPITSPTLTASTTRAASAATPVGSTAVDAAYRHHRHRSGGGSSCITEGSTRSSSSTIQNAVTTASTNYGVGSALDLMATTAVQASYEPLSSQHHQSEYRFGQNAQLQSMKYNDKNNGQAGTYAAPAAAVSYPYYNVDGIESQPLAPPPPQVDISNPDLSMVGGPPGGLLLEPAGLSIGSISMTSVSGAIFDSKFLEPGGMSFGSTVIATAGTTTEPSSSTVVPSHPMRQQQGVFKNCLQPVSAKADLVRSNSSNYDKTYDGDGNVISHRHSIDSADIAAAALEPPTQLDPVGISFGELSVMSMDNNANSNTHNNYMMRKLDSTGMSFGSITSLPDSSSRYIGESSADMVDGGLLEAVGTSFGSISITSATPPVESMAYSNNNNAKPSQQPVPSQLQLHQPSNKNSKQRQHQHDEEGMAAAAAMPTFLQQQRSTGNLLDCSDTESDDSESARGKSMHKSQEWQKLKAMLETSTNLNSSTSGAMPVPTTFYVPSRQAVSSSKPPATSGKNSHSSSEKHPYNQFYPSYEGVGNDYRAPPAPSHGQGQYPSQQLHQSSQFGGANNSSAWPSSSSSSAYTRTGSGRGNEGDAVRGSASISPLNHDDNLMVPPPQPLKKIYYEDEDDEDYDLSTREHLEKIFLNRGDSLVFEQFHSTAASSGGGNHHHDEEAIRSSSYFPTDSKSDIQKSKT